MRTYPEPVGRPTILNDVFLPIHLACEVGAPLEIIQRLLVVIYPEALSTAFRYGEVHHTQPSRAACQRENPSPETLQFLSDEYPDCFRLLGTNVNLPLFHYCCRSGNSEECL
jgi:hypothetical protein